MSRTDPTILIEALKRARDEFREIHTVLQEPKGERTIMDLIMELENHRSDAEQRALAGATRLRSVLLEVEEGGTTASSEMLLSSPPRGGEGVILPHHPPKAPMPYLIDDRAALEGLPVLAMDILADEMAANDGLCDNGTLAQVIDNLRINGLPEVYDRDGYHPPFATIELATGENRIPSLGASSGILDPECLRRDVIGTLDPDDRLYLKFHQEGAALVVGTYRAVSVAAALVLPACSTLHLERMGNRWTGQLATLEDLDALVERAKMALDEERRAYAMAQGSPGDVEPRNYGFLLGVIRKIHLEDARPTLFRDVDRAYAMVPLGSRSLYDLQAALISKALGVSESEIPAQEELFLHLETDAIAIEGWGGGSYDDTFQVRATWGRGADSVRPIYREVFPGGDL